MRTCEDTSQRDSERLGCFYVVCWNIDNSEIDWYNGEMIDWHLVEGKMCMCWEERGGTERFKAEDEISAPLALPN